jgi:ParB family transcriptional regulator, chromosome partitioning protein
MAERKASLSDLPVTDIVVPKDRLRPISEAKVAGLMIVLEDGVFLGAITVRRVAKTMVLIDGAHRLEAMRRLGRATIRADVLDCNAGEARRKEVTGNILAGMTPVQDAIFLGVYQQEYEKLHPETKRGVAGALAKNGLQRANLHFADVVAESRQITPGQVRRIIAAGRALGVDERKALQTSEHRIALSEIEKLGKIGDPSLRARSVAALVTGKSVAEAIRAAKAETDGKEPAPKDAVEDAFNALMKAWTRAPMAAKKRFLLEQAQEVWEAQNKGAALTNWAEAAG